MLHKATITVEVDTDDPEKARVSCNFDPSLEFDKEDEGNLTASIVASFLKGLEE